MTGNFVGLRPDGSAFSNGAGISLGDTLGQIGGPQLGDRNVISNSETFGLRVAGNGADGSVIVNNLIGTGMDTATDLGNIGSGVEINGSSGVLLGTTSAPANVIAFNGRGVLVLGAGTGNQLYANEYIDNDTLSIDLSSGAGADGVTANDINDVDSGPNNLQNFPVLTDGSAQADSITVAGTLDLPTGITTPVAYTLAFYESLVCDASGNGEGEVLLATRQVNFASNAENFSVTLPIPPGAGGSVLTATATDPLGNTSEFSNCLASPQPVTIFADGFE
jgi:hypothetical protein